MPTNKKKELLLAMNFIKNVFACLPFYLLCLPTLAQSSELGIHGKIIQADGEEVPFANVFLLSKEDSSIVKGVAASLEGEYTIDDIKPGTFLIMATMVGYKKGFSPVFEYTGGNLRIADLRLDVEVKALEEVKVVAQKPFIEQEVDRTVINVENSIVSAGSTALEVLEKSPGVTVDQQNDRLKLRGKDGVIVHIDGKQTYLSESELVNLLRNTPSDNIEKIELITNPSAKYDAAGNSGIINIKFKKNKNFGTNGNISLGMGVADHSKLRGNGTLALNHRQGKLSWNAHLNGFQGEGFNNQNIKRVIPFEGKNTTFNSLSISDWKAHFYSYRIGVDYYLSNKTTLGALVSGFSNKWENPFRTTHSDIYDHEMNLDQRFSTNVQASNRMRNLTGNINLKHQFDDKGKELTFDLDYVNYNQKGYNGMETRYESPNQTNVRPDEILRSNMPATINIGVAKLDYTQPLGKGKLETGLKSSYVVADNDMVMELFADVWHIDTNRTNRFKYTENINAAYINYSGKFSEKTKFQIGVRGEHTHSIGNSVTLDEINDRNYFNLFPSVFLSQSLDSSNVLNLSYSYRIDRPNYQSLNPFEYYLDPYTFQRGNPNLRPQYTHSFQLTHVFKSFLNTTLAYSRIKDVISNEVPQVEPEENITYVTNENLDNQNYFSLTVSAPLPINKWWTLQLNATATYNEFKTFYRNATYDVNIFTYNLFGNNTFKLPNEWAIEAGGWFNGPTIYGLINASPQGALNLGIQKSIWNKKGNIKLNVQDPFSWNRFKGETHFEDIHLNIHSTWPSRQIRLAFSYRFGNQNVKTRQRSIGSDDLQQRVGGQN